MDIAQEATITRGAKNVTLATRKPHLGLPDQWAPLLPWSWGANWLWRRDYTEIRVLFTLYKMFPAEFVDWLVGWWSRWWARKHQIPEWEPVGTGCSYPLTNSDVQFSKNVAFVFRTTLVEPIREKNL